MSNNTTSGTVVAFSAAAEFEDGETIVLYPSRPSKAEALEIGFNYFEASTSDKAMDAMLDEFGPVLIRRSLRTFANFAKRNSNKEVAAYCESLREDIKVVIERDAKTA
jgi:hypothetical protein